MTEGDKSDFIKYSLQKVHFYIESQFWSKLDNDTLNKWLNNFKTVDEKYCAAKLLDRFVYYSEEDTLQLLEYGFNELILKRYILDYELNNDFKISNGTILDHKNAFFDKTLVLPLMADNNLSESSLAMTRALTKDLGFSESKILGINNLSNTVLANAKNLIILDDFIGTGKQIFDFWNSSKVKIDGEDILINSIKNKFPNIEIEYLCLICTEEGYNNFHSYNSAEFNVGLRITYCEMLTSKFKVFGSNSVYFEKNEVDDSRAIIEKLCEENGINLLGYKGLDYAIAFHHDIPDSSLPIFHKQTENWNPLFRNKKTNL